MKFILCILTVLFVIPLNAQVDRSKPPEPGPAPEIELGTYEHFELPNGLKVFLVENHKLPRISFSLQIDRNPILEGDTAGYISAAGQLLRTGTRSRSKEELDETIDFIGADLSTSSTGIYAMSLTEHADTLFKIMSDIILNSEFKKAELDKIKTRMKSDLASQKDDPDAIAGTVKNVVDFGKDHPYGEPETEQTVDNITLEKCNEYYKTFFAPNISYLAVVGDIDEQKAKELVTNYLGGWQRKDVPQYKYPVPQPPVQTTVDLVDRPNSVQSVVNVTYPVQLKPGDSEAIPASLMNTILGGGTFRLFQDLREKHSFTYGANSRLSKDEYAGSFTAFTNVRNAVTDSAITRILYEMNRIKNETVADSELQVIKNYVTGNFAISLESPQTIATFAINIDKYNLPRDYYANYLKNVAKVTPAEIRDAAEKFIRPDQSNIVIVGNADQIKQGLTKFGPILYYDKYGKEIDTSLASIPGDLSAMDVINHYIKAIGGRNSLANVHDRTTVMKGTVQGYEVTTTIYQKEPDLFKQEVDAGGMIQEITYNGKNGEMQSAGQQMKIEGNELEKLKHEATIHLLLAIDSLGVKLKLAGMEKVNGKDAYKIEMMFPSGTKWIQYYDPETGYKIKETKNITTPQGTFTQEIYYNDYRTVDGVKYPFSIKQSVGPQSMEFKVDSIKVNTRIPDTKFQ
ncbi:MAG TPA: insulinase family protein [Ignavibacteriaceae bacterium]|nr:insulinase family protein [Ignavibacteriaceae bacterium]